MDLLSSIDSSVSTDSEAGLRNSIELFSRIVDEKLYISSLNRKLKDFSGGIESGSIFTSGKFLILESLDEVELLLIRYTGNTEHIYSSPVDFIQAQISDGAYEVDSYACDFDISEELFSTTRTIYREKSERISDDQCILKTVNDVISLHNFSNLPAVFLRVSQKPKGDFEWAFDRRTLRARSYSTIRLAESNLCGLFDLIAEIDDPRSIEILNMFSDHEYHFVRWGAVKAIGHRNADLGLELAKRALADSHPHVRLAAEKTLKNWDERNLSGQIYD